MKILYITFSPLQSNAGHTARLKTVLKNVSMKNDVFVMCLNGRDNKEVRSVFSDVKFVQMKAVFNGWTVVNSKKLSKDILDFCNSQEMDIVIMCMEVWDLMRDLSNLLSKNITFTTILNAMPFLITPLNPSGDFENDVKNFIKEGIPEYRKKYIKRHYTEIEEVFKKLNIISHNDTVDYYIKSYFPNIKTFKLPNIFLSNLVVNKVNIKIKYDLVYMARIEKGKGIEYLEEILLKLSKKLNKKVSLLILGRTDDLYSKNILDLLLKKSLRSKYFKVDFKGWASEKQKIKLLPTANIFIYPSVLDTLAVVVNEAISSGLPVVTWNSNFYNMNYKKQNFVIPSKMFSTEDFVDNIIYAMDHKNELLSCIVKYLDTQKEKSFIIKEEVNLYRIIIKNEKNKR